MNDIKIIIKKNIKDKDTISKILKVKDSEWRFGLKKQKLWFKENIQKNDIHILIEYKKKIIGYLLLRDRKCNYNKIKKNYYFFDTLLIIKKFRQKNLSKLLINKSLELIKKKKYFSVLICNKNKISFYAKFGWMLSNKIFILDYKEKKHKMIFNKKINRRLDILINS